jgi:hypothetical protein
MWLFEVLALKDRQAFTQSKKASNPGNTMLRGYLLSYSSYLYLPSQQSEQPSLSADIVDCCNINLTFSQ